MKNIAVFAHDVVSQFHLPLEIRIVRRQAKTAVGRLGGVNRFA